MENDKKAALKKYMGSASVPVDLNEVRDRDKEENEWKNLSTVQRLKEHIEKNSKAYYEPIQRRTNEILKSQEEFKMTYTKEDCIKDTKEHINQVRRLMMIVMNHLSYRASIHDQSKLESPELEGFTEYTPKLKNSTYGSDEYKEFLNGLKVTLDHHYANNSHHPEHYEDGVSGMDLLDVIEMFCDWKAATMRHADGDINKSIEINQKRFGMSDELTQIFRNTVKIFEEESN